MVWLLLCLSGAQMARAAEQVETNAFRAAALEYEAGFWRQADVDFADFVRKYPASSRLPEAILCQAIARYHLTNYPAAIELLASRVGQAGKRADEYVFWQAKALLAKGDNGPAAEAFARVNREYPGSVLALEAGIEEARARAAAGNWGRVVELLEKPDGVFRSAARTNATAEAVAGGWLLLGEARLARREFPGVEAAVAPLAGAAREGRRLSPGVVWGWWYLTARLRLAQGRPEEAWAACTNLLAAAAAGGDSAQRAATYAFAGALLERLGRAAEAVNIYTNSLVAGIPADRQAEALCRVTELLAADGRVAQAAARLEDFVSRLPDTANTPLAWLLLGELRLRGHLAPAGGTNAPGATNLLDQAISALSQVGAATNRPSATNWVGRAALDLGWCHWLQGHWAEAQADFQTAVDHLPPSLDQATARFKLADALYEQTNYPGAVAQYQAIIDRYGGVAGVRDALFEPALYQVARAALAGGDLATATNALARISAWFPGGFRADRVALLTGQVLSRRGDPAGARQLFAEAARRAPGTPLAAQFGLAVARTYERENQLPRAIEAYQEWLRRYPGDPSAPQAEYCLGIDQFLAGDITNALTVMTNFVSRHPVDPLRPLAQWWLGDYYYRYDDQLKAEGYYHEVYQNTNLPTSDLTYRSQLMAGRAAARRQDWPAAITHFTNLTSDARCPKPVWAEAMFAYGEALISRDNATNKMGDLAEAGGVFNQIRIDQPTNRLAAAALGMRANCYWQLAQQKGQSGLLTNAAQAYLEAMSFSGADVAVRSAAEDGLGMVLERQAALRPEAERRALLDQALERYLHVFFRKNLGAGEPADPFWLKKSGLDAARLAEDLGLWSQAIKVYQDLAGLIPPLRPSLELRMASARQRAGPP